jgi:hypothetical protein
MPQDPSSQLEHTVLDMIEHSPIGAVPHTPAYQDALRRLYAAHQAYPSADHKDCHVTARSLSQLPLFHAHNIEELSSGNGDSLELNSAIFDRYVQSLPVALQSKAESRRAMVAGRPALHRAKHGGIVAHDPIHTLFLVPGAGPHPGLPGNYLYGFIAQGSSDTTWSVHLHDSEDGAIHYHASSIQDALAKYQEILESAPFHMSELEALGLQLT